MPIHVFSKDVNGSYFGTQVVYGLYVATKVLDCWYGLEEKGQGQQLLYYLVINVCCDICNGSARVLAPFLFFTEQWEYSVRFTKLWHGLVFVCPFQPSAN